MAMTDIERSTEDFNASEKSLPDQIENSIESPPVGGNRFENAETKTAVTASGDRAVVLMDLDNGLVGWESADDPENPT
jgi:hypothetical protein